jgi:hypothetical protein
VRDDAELRRVDAERRQRVAPALGVDDDAVEAAEQRAPERRAAPCAGQQVVGGEDERRRSERRSTVELGHGEPLEVDDVRRPASEPRIPSGCSSAFAADGSAPAMPLDARVERLSTSS